MEVLSDVGAAAAFVAAGVIVLILGYVVTDLTTPGNLSKLICDDRNKNAAVIAASNVVAAGIIVNVPFWPTPSDFWEGLLPPFPFGLVGVFPLAVADWVVDVLVPADLRGMI